MTDASIRPAKSAGKPQRAPAKGTEAAARLSLAVADTREAPRHLKPATRLWWTRISESYALEPHHIALLTVAGEAYDRLVEARETLGTAGAYYHDRFGQPRAHPAVTVERDARLSFARLIRELGLETGDIDAGLPRVRGRR